MTTPRFLPVAMLIAWSLCGCAKPNDQAWSTKSESISSRPRSMASSADQPIPGRRGEEIVVKAPEPEPAQRIEPHRQTPQPNPVTHATEAPQVEPTVSPTIDTLASPADIRQAAITMLEKFADARSPQLRANAIEAMELAPERLEPVVRRGLGDENRGVRFVAAMTVGRLKLTSLAPLLEPLLLDESQSVQAAAIYGLRRCGRGVNPTPLAPMLLSEDPEVKGNAALVFGELGDPSAIPVLENAVGRGLTRVAQARAKIVELQLAEAMVKLGAENSVVPIRAALFAPAEEAEIVALACQMCGRLHDGRAAIDLQNILSRSGSKQPPAEVRMAAAMALAEIDPAKAVPEVPLAYVESDQFQLRAQAASTLGVIANPNTLPHLVRLMNDTNPLVQAAAAGAVLRMRENQQPLTAR